MGQEISYKKFSKYFQYKLYFNLTSQVEFINDNLVSVFYNAI